MIERYEEMKAARLKRELCPSFDEIVNSINDALFGMTTRSKISSIALLLEMLPLVYSEYIKRLDMENVLSPKEREAMRSVFEEDISRVESSHMVAKTAISLFSPQCDDERLSA